MKRLCRAFSTECQALGGNIMWQSSIGDGLVSLYVCTWQCGVAVFLCCGVGVVVLQCVGNEAEALRDDGLSGCICDISIYTYINMYTSVCVRQCFGSAVLQCVGSAVLRRCSMLQCGAAVCCSNFAMLLQCVWRCM